MKTFSQSTTIRFIKYYNRAREEHSLLPLTDIKLFDDALTDFFEEENYDFSVLELTLAEASKTSICMAKEVADFLTENNLFVLVSFLLEAYAEAYRSLEKRKKEVKTTKTLTCDAFIQEQFFPKGTVVECFPPTKVKIDFQKIEEEKEQLLKKYIFKASLKRYLKNDIAIERIYRIFSEDALNYLAEINGVEVKKEITLEVFEEFSINSLVEVIFEMGMEWEIVEALILS